MKNKTYLVWSEGLETWMIAGDADTAAEMVKHEAHSEMMELEDGDVVEIRIKRQDLTDAEINAAPEV